MRLIDQLLRLENFFWAWEKAKAAFSFDKTWFDEIALHQFEGDLQANLNQIQTSFKRGEYLMSPAQLIAFPKRGDSKDPTPKTRQMFAFSVRDQVAWIALVNVIGPLIDRQMPSWSYGDRLYRSVWRARSGVPADIEPRGSLQIGPYRHTARHLYRPFKFAWPRYRKHLYLTASIMASISERPEALSLQDAEMLDDERALLSDDVRVPYLSREYWPTSQNKIYWAGLDLTKFFPSTPASLVENAIADGLRTAVPNYRDELGTLIRSMLVFPVSSDGWTKTEIADELLIPESEQRTFAHLPTGLLVSGFLANVAMLRVDREVNEKLRIDVDDSDHHLSQFRYVDDHVVLATSADALLEWIPKYERILASHNPDWRLNTTKIAPDEVSACLLEEDPSKKATLMTVVAAKPLDSRFPRPLLSHTLTKISVIASTRFELLDDVGQHQFIQDLEMMLLGDFGPSEVRPDTRASFAASTLSRALPHLRQMTTEAWQATVDRQRCQERIAAIAATRESLRSERIPDHLLDEENELTGQLKQLVRNEHQARTVLLHSRKKDERRTFELLLNAISRYPDKIRLWQTAVSYCARMGYQGINALVDFLSEEAELNPITKSYVIAVVTHATATELIGAVRRFADSSSAPEDRESAARFIKSIAPLRLAASVDARWYGPRAWAHLISAGFSAITCIDKLISADLFQSQETQAVREALTVFETESVLDLRVAVRILAASKQSPGRLADSALWIEDTINRYSSEPSAVWTRLRLRIGYQSGSERSFHARFPNHVTKAELSGMAVGRVAPFSTNEGWFYDALLTKTQAELNSIGASAKGNRQDTQIRIRRAIQGQKRRPHALRLDEWVVWQRAYPISGVDRLERMSDPRLGEWTALIIVTKMVRELKGLNIGERPAIHPSTLLIPRAWTKESETAPGGMSWSEWRQLVEYRPLRLVSRKLALSDDRYMGPGWTTDSALPREWPWVRATGLLLLGLLRKSFSWPAIWNPDYSQNSSSRVGRSMIAALPCSSVTVAILEATVGQRARENVLRRDELPLEQLATDTSFDPPVIGSLDELDKWLRESMRILEANQLDGRQNRARQLLPLNIRQLTRPEWREADAIEVDE